MPTPNPGGPNTSFPRLTGISCGTSESCMAVGRSYTTTNRLVTLAEHWNGRAWTIQATLNPLPGAGWELRDVACVTATWCTAVGGYLRGSLAEHWNGTVWTLQPGPLPSGTLMGVACPTTSSCTAVGGYGPSQLIAATWNGSAWTAGHPIIPSGSFAAVLSGVACSDPSTCLAVGWFQTTFQGPTSSLIERRHGNSWTRLAEPGPVGAQATSLSAVSCTGVSACTAVGSYTDAGGAQHPLVERWDGRGWALQAGVQSVNGALLGVSCTTASACTATGWYWSPPGTPFKQPLAAAWSGTAWTQQATPFLTDPQHLHAVVDSALHAVWCARPSSCIAAGYLGTGWTGQTVVERYGG